jgi:flagellar basal body rod protein FlgF
MLFSYFATANGKESAFKADNAALKVQVGVLEEDNLQQMAALRRL